MNPGSTESNHGMKASELADGSDIYSHTLFPIPVLPREKKCRGDSFLLATSFKHSFARLPASLPSSVNINCDSNKKKIIHFLRKRRATHKLAVLFVTR